MESQALNNNNSLACSMPGSSRTYAMINSMFDMLTIGVACIRKNGELMYANQAAIGMLNRSGIIVAKSEHLNFNSKINDLALKKLNLDTNQTVVIRRQNIELQLQVKPFRNTYAINTDQIERRQTAMLILHESGSVALPCIEQLKSLFDLTPAEARLALALCSGYTVSECAENMGVCITTIRTQLRAVMEKTGSHRQAELLTKLLSCPSASIRAA